MSGVPPIGAAAGEPKAGQRGRVGAWLRSPKNIGGLIIVVLAVWFIFANTSSTRIRLWVVWVTAQLWLVLAVTFVAGMLAGYLLARRARRARRPQA
jgi:uncharacterized integral membrane protein